MMLSTHRSESKLIIAAALEEELSSIKKQIDGYSDVSFHAVGIGPRMAYQGVRSMLGNGSTMERSPLLLLVGFAGAVDPSLRSGDLVMSNRYYRKTERSGPLTNETNGGPLASRQSNDAVSPDFLEPDQIMNECALKAAHAAGVPLVTSPSLTVDRLIASPTEKRAVFQQNLVAIVNMEDYWAAAAAREAGVSFLSVRAVVDVADQNLPDYLPSVSEPRYRVAMSTISHPWRVATLTRLGIQMRRSQRSLARFAGSFIAMITNTPDADFLVSASDAGNSGQLSHFNQSSSDSVGLDLQVNPYSVAGFTK